MLVEDKGAREEDEKEQGQAEELSASRLRPVCFPLPHPHRGFLSVSIPRIVQKAYALCAGIVRMCRNSDRTPNYR